MSLTIFLPVFNEEKNLLSTIKKIEKLLLRSNFSYEVIIFDDGSNDNSKKLIKEIASKKKFIRPFYNEKNKGLGFSYNQAVLKSKKKFFVYIPSDNTWTSNSLKKLFLNFGRADVITSYIVNTDIRPIHRRLLSRLFTTILNMIHNKNIKYFNGLTIYPKSFLINNLFDSTGFDFQSELLLKAIYNNLNLIELPLEICNQSNNSHSITVKNVLLAIKNIIKNIKFRFVKW